MKRIITMFGLISLAIVGLFLASQVRLLAKSSATTETIEIANQLYEAGEFATAAQGYQQLVDQGFTESTLYYNLGNAYFKQGDIGRAILNYRRAEQFAPRDPDIEANLALARSQIIDQLDEKDGKEGLLSHVAQLSQTNLTLNELAMTTLIIWIQFVFLVIGFGSSKKDSKLREALQYALIATGLVLTVGIIGLGSRMYLENTRPEAVVVASEINVTSGPGTQYVTEFTLHSGTEVNLVETRENWVRLTLLSDDLQGWVPASAVETIAQLKN